MALDMMNHVASNILPASFVLVTICWIYFCLTSAYPRVGNSRLWTWLPKAIPMRYALDQYATDGYLKINKKRNQAFIMKFFGFDYLMMPSRYLEDLKKAASEALSFNVSFSDAFNLGASVGDLYFSDNMGLAVSRYLNKQLKSFIPDLVEEVKYAFNLEIGRPLEWKEITAAKVNAGMIHRLTNLIVVGRSLCRDETFSQTSFRFTSTLLPSAVWTNFISFGPLRDMASRLTTFFHKWELEATLKLLIPVVEERLRKKDCTESRHHNDSIQWLIEIASQSDDPREMAPRRIAENVLHLLFAANSAPGALVTQMMYESLMSPNYLKDLRSEIDAATAAERGWTANALENMPLLDSYVRETLRLYPPGSIACTRTVMGQPYTLHDGTILPKGSRIAFPILAIQTDPENYKDPSKFDGYRFLKKDPKTKAYSPSISSSTITTDFLPFGYGKHACPGRFFGILEAKLVFGMLVQEFDLKWASDVRTRPANASIEGMVPPNQDARVLIRARARQG